MTAHLMLCGYCGRYVPYPKGMAQYWYAECIACNEARQIISYRPGWGDLVFWGSLIVMFILLGCVLILE